MVSRDTYMLHHFLRSVALSMCGVDYGEPQYEVFVVLLAKIHSFHQKEQHSSNLKV